MLAQEGLAEMGLSSPSEQVAYLLVERATLRERLEAAERALGGVSPTDGQTEFQQQVKRRSPSELGSCPLVLVQNVCLCDVTQVQVCHSVLEEQQQEALQKTINVATKVRRLRRVGFSSVLILCCINFCVDKRLAATLVECRELYTFVLYP